jgi:hypothetical protein
MTGSIASIDGLHAMQASSKCRACCREKPVNEQLSKEFLQQLLLPITESRPDSLKMNA